MSTKEPVKTQAKTPAPPVAARIPQPPVVGSEHEAERLDIAAQLEGAARLGHSLGDVNVDSAALPIIQRQEIPEEEEKELQMKREPAAVQRQELPEEEEELMLMRVDQRMGPQGGQVSPEVEAAIQRARGGGQPLAGTVLAQMSASLGHDFSGVRVHADSEADALNQQLQAKAFTTGPDIFFKRGVYEPGSSNGRELIAHELSHVVQQSSGRVNGDGSGMTVRPAGDAFEQEADRVAEAVTTSTSNSVQVRTTKAENREPGLLAQRRPEATPDLAPPPGTLAGQRAVGNWDGNRCRATGQREGSSPRRASAVRNAVIQARVSGSVPGGVVQRHGTYEDEWKKLDKKIDSSEVENAKTTFYEKLKVKQSTTINQVLYLLGAIDAALPLLFAEQKTNGLPAATQLFEFYNKGLLEHKEWSWGLAQNFEDIGNGLAEEPSTDMPGLSGAMDVLETLEQKGFPTEHLKAAAEEIFDTDKPYLTIVTQIKKWARRAEEGFIANPEKAFTSWLTTWLKQETPGAYTDPYTARAPTEGDRKEIGEKGLRTNGGLLTYFGDKEENNTQERRRAAVDKIIWKWVTNRGSSKTENDIFTEAAYITTASLAPLESIGSLSAVLKDYGTIEGKKAFTSRMLGLE